MGWLWKWVPAKGSLVQVTAKAGASGGWCCRCGTLKFTVKRLYSTTLRFTLFRIFLNLLALARLIIIVETSCDGKRTSSDVTKEKNIQTE